MTLTEMREHLAGDVAELVGKAEAATEQKIRDRLLDRAESILKCVKALDQIIGGKQA